MHDSERVLSGASLRSNPYWCEFNCKRNRLLEVLHETFDAGNPVHQKLADLSKKAHELSAGCRVMGPELERVESQIDLWAAKLWNLTDAELEEIQQSLAELE